MEPMVWVSALVMLFPMEVWALYGIVMEPRATHTVNCVGYKEVASRVPPIIRASFSRMTSQTSPPVIEIRQRTHQPILPPTVITLFDRSMNPQTASFTASLTTSTILGISISLTVSIILIIFLIFGIPFLRRWRRSRALQRAVDEVERGIELRKQSGHASTSEVTESKENMVLESIVEIVVGDEDIESDVMDAWDGWNATWAGDENEDREERTRKGMSLPRRQY